MSRKSGLRAVQNQNKEQHVEIVSQEDNNPLPPIDQLEKLHSFRPDLVDQVVDMVSNETKYRHQFEKEQFEYYKKTNDKNAWLVYSVCVFCLIVTFVLGIIGKEIAAFATCIIPIMAVVSKLITKK